VFRLNYSNSEMSRFVDMYRVFRSSKLTGYIKISLLALLGKLCLSRIYWLG